MSRKTPEHQHIDQETANRLALGLVHFRNNVLSPDEAPNDSNVEDEDLEDSDGHELIDPSRFEGTMNPKDGRMAIITCKECRGSVFEVLGRSRMAAGALVPYVEDEIEEYEEGKKLAVEEKIKLGDEAEVDKLIQEFERGEGGMNDTKNGQEIKPLSKNERYLRWVFLIYIRDYRKGCADIIGDEAFLKKHRVVRKSK